MPGKEFVKMPVFNKKPVERVKLPTIIKKPISAPVLPVVKPAVQRILDVEKEPYLLRPIQRAEVLQPLPSEPLKASGPSFASKPQVMRTPDAMTKSFVKPVLPNQPEPANVKKSFPSAGSFQTTAPLTDAFVPKPSTSERIDAFLKTTGNDFLQGLDKIGSYPLNLLEKIALEKVQKQQQKQEIFKQAEEAKQRGDGAEYFTKIMQAASLDPYATPWTDAEAKILQRLTPGANPTSAGDETANIFRANQAAAKKTLYQGLKPGEQAMIGVAEQGVGMLSNFAVSQMSGIPYPFLSAATRGAEAGQEALDKGYGSAEAAMMGTGAGAIRYATESLGGASGDWGKQLLSRMAGTKTGQALLSRVPETVLSYIGNLSKNKAAQIFGTGLAEGGENLADYELQRVYQNLILDENTPFDVKEALSNVASGVLFGGTVKGLEMIGSGIKNRIADGRANGVSNAPPVLNDSEAGSGAKPEPRGIQGFLVTAPTKEQILQVKKDKELDLLKKLDMESKPIIREYANPPGDRPRTTQETADLNALLNQSHDVTAVPDVPKNKHVRKVQNQFYNDIRSSLPLPHSKAGKLEARAAIETLTAELADRGTIYQETADRVFEKLYDSARVINRDFYDQYKDLKKELRETKFFLSDADRGNIPHFEAFRLTNAGNFTVTRSPEGIPVDAKYQELRYTYPELFPADITHPADQLVRISEVSKSIIKSEDDMGTFYGEDEPTFKEYARQEFDDALADLAEQVAAIPEVNMREDTEIGTPEAPAGQDYADESDFLNRVDKGLVDDPEIEDILREAYRNARELQPAAFPEGLLDTEKHYVDGIARGLQTPEEIPNIEAKELILEVAAARKAFLDALEPVRDYNQKRIQALEAEAREALQNSDLWKEKATGIQYQRETMERNIRDIVPNKEEAELIIDRFFTPVHENEAKRNQFLNDYRERVKKLDLSEKESKWVQLIGEGEKDFKDLPLGMEPVKIAKAIAEFKYHIYPELYNQVSDAIMRNGYAPPGHVDNYFPHFNDPNDLLTSILKTVGIEVDLQELPTEIAGITENFEPGKSFMANLLHRSGNKTDYDAVKGFDRYIEASGNLIYHTEDIQRLRVLEAVLRDKYAVKKTGREQLDELSKQPLPTDFYKDWDAEKQFGQDVSNLSRFVTELHSYTNSLAGKKNINDRSLEHKLGRGLYSVSKALEGRVAANMVGMNPASWLTNYIPIVQGGSSLKKKNLAQAMDETMKNYLIDDGFETRSAFLTNRTGSERLSKNKVQEMADKLTSPMQAIDRFTANILVRGRYLDNLDAGMNEAVAMREADKWTASVMADRSKGALPTIFEEKNFVTKMFTMFQVETNNQLSYLFKDLPRDAQKKGGKWLAATLLQLGIGSWLYNQIYEYFVGRRPAADPIGIAVNFAEDLNDGSGKEWSNLGQNITEQLPFTGILNFAGIKGGGRLPISSAIPDLSKMDSAIRQGASGEIAPNTARERVWKEASKPLYYLVPPVGGGQVKKVVEGGQALLQGGVYNTNSKGGKDLLYPVERTPGSIAQGVLFGKSAFPEAREYYQDFKPVQPTMQSERDAAKTASLPRIIDYSYGEGDEKTSGSITLSGKGQKAYQEAFASLLPTDVSGLTPQQQKKVYQYAEQVARNQVLSGAGVDQYEPDEWVQKAQAAVKVGVPIEQYLQVQELFNRFRPIQDKEGKTSVTAIEQRREALLEMQGLSAKQKESLDQILVQSGDEKKHVDYSDRNSFRYSLLDETAQKRYDLAASAFDGITVDTFEGIMKILGNVEGEKNADGRATANSRKLNQLKRLIKLGLSRKQAYTFYSIAAASTPDARPEGLNVKDMNAVSYSLLSASQRENYDELRSYIPNLPVADFQYILDSLGTVKGYRDRNGKTISGSLKRNQIQMLVNMGVSLQNAYYFVNIL